MKGFFVGVAVVVVLGGGLILANPMFRLKSGVQGAGMAQEVVDETLDGENAIYNYEWFKMQEESIQSLYNKEVTAQAELDTLIEMLPEDRSEWAREDKDEYSRLSANVTGIKNMTDDAMAEYNAKSKMVNRTIFKDNLPTNLTRGFYEGLELTK